MVLKLKRARTWRELAAFDVHDLPAHCAEAAVALFATDVLALADAEAEANAPLALAKLAELCLRPDAFMWTKLQGGLQCTLCTAVFTALLAHMPAAAENVAWAERRGLRGSVGGLPWTLTDLMYALHSLAVHWERICARCWGRPAEEKQLETYLAFLWSQCAYFVVRCTTSLDGGSKHTIPYTATDAEHEVSVSPSTVAEMCAVWRAVVHQRRWKWSLGEYAEVEGASEIFLRVFAFEKAQLTVSTFRETLRERLASRFLLLGDAETWRATQGGKPLDVDLALGARGARHMPGFVQEAALSWDWDKMQTHQCTEESRMICYGLKDGGTMNAFGMRFSMPCLAAGAVYMQTERELADHVKHVSGDLSTDDRRRAVLAALQHDPEYHQLYSRLHQNQELMDRWSWRASLGASVKPKTDFWCPFAKEWDALDTPSRDVLANAWVDQPKHMFASPSKRRRRQPVDQYEIIRQAWSPTESLVRELDFRRPGQVVTPAPLAELQTQYAQFCERRAVKSKPSGWRPPERTSPTANPYPRARLCPRWQRCSPRKDGLPNC